jgi:hypothetical protein
MFNDPDVSSRLLLLMTMVLAVVGVEGTAVLLSFFLFCRYLTQKL